MDPRLTTIRLTLALLASLALLWLWPAWAWVPVALFMPPALLDVGPPPECCDGVSVPSDLQFTAIHNGACGTLSGTLVYQGVCPPIGHADNDASGYQILLDCENSVGCVSDCYPNPTFTISKLGSDPCEATVCLTLHSCDPVYMTGTDGNWDIEVTE